MLYQIFFPYRDEWGVITYVRSGKMVPSLKRAMLQLEKLPRSSFIRTHTGRFVMEKTT